MLSLKERRLAQLGGTLPCSSLRGTLHSLDRTEYIGMLDSPHILATATYNNALASPFPGISQQSLLAIDARVGLKNPPAAQRDSSEHRKARGL